MNYIEQEGLSHCKKRQKKLLGMSPHAFAVLKLNALIAKYCKMMDIENAFMAYQESKINFIFPSPSTYANLLSLAAGFGDQGSGNNYVREIEPPSNYDTAHQIFTDMKCRSIPITESCFTAMIRCYCLNDKATEALQLYYDMKQHLTTASTENEQALSSTSRIPKLRTFYPLLKLFSTLNDLNTCFYLYNEIRYIYKLIPTEREYICMLNVCMKSHNERFYNIIDDMIEDIFIPSLDTWNILKLWFTDENTRIKN